MGVGHFLSAVVLSLGWSAGTGTVRHATAVEGRHASSVLDAAFGKLSASPRWWELALPPHSSGGQWERVSPDGGRHGGAFHGLYHELELAAGAAEFAHIGRSGRGGWEGQWERQVGHFARDRPHGAGLAVATLWLCGQRRPLPLALPLPIQARAFNADFTPGHR